ncbi:ComEC/Rec2 family competence protein [Anaerostipes sp.]|uniref:ComEC/Rec2 family competence protein n=1 Tax=Anaerostipes sp. TaxID=1872530 RepID=UPI0039672487
MNKGIKKITACLLIILMTITLTPIYKVTHKVSAAQNFKIHFIDVGCADGALLQYGEGSNAKYAMIDTGAGKYNGTKDKTYAKKKYPAYEYLKKMGVNHLEFVILTHPHRDHIGGLVKILKDKTITINTIYGNSLEMTYLRSNDNVKEQTSETAKWTKFDSDTYQNVKDEIEKRNSEEDESLHVKYVIPKAGSKIYLGQAQITFYGPLENNYKYGRQVDLNVRQENKYSIVTRIVYGKNSFLMTGDAQRETIEKIIKKGYNLQAQVLKEPHHGYQDVKEKDKLIAGRTSDHKLLIDHTKANIAVISNGYKNTGEVPMKNVLTDLSKMDIYETGNRGTIVITSDGSHLYVRTEKGGNKPSVNGKIILSGKSISMPVLQSIDIVSNKKTKILPAYPGTKDAKSIYTNKNVTIKINASARSFTKINSVQYKIVKKGQSSAKLPYRYGKSVTLKNGTIAKVYVKYNTMLGEKKLKLPQIVVDTKAPTKLRLKKKKSGKKKKVTFSANYGTSGKKKTAYKLVPKGKSAKKYKWKTANDVRYDAKKYRKARLYVRFIDKAGNSKTTKMSI